MTKVLVIDVSMIEAPEEESIINDALAKLSKKIPKYKIASSCATDKRMYIFYEDTAIPVKVADASKENKKHTAK